MPKYSVAVALFDYLPILASASGLWWLRRLPATHTHIYKVFVVGAASVVVGGLCKASWKLMTALGITPPTGLDTLLFLLMPAGFVMLAAALHQLRRQLHSNRTTLTISASYALAWLPALLFAVSLPQSRLWFVWLLALSVFATAAFLWQSAMIARTQSGATLSISLLVYCFCSALAMAGLARLPASEMTAWAQELTNLSGQLALAAACWRIQRKGYL